MCEITESTKFRNIISEIYSNQWVVGTVEVPNVFRTEGACCHAVMHFSTWLYHLREPFSLLDLIASEFWYIWIWNEVFVKWSFYGAKFPSSFIWVSVSYGLVTVAWDSSKICLFYNVGIEAVWNECYESACVMSLLWWLKKYQIGI